MKDFTVKVEFVTTKEEWLAHTMQPFYDPAVVHTMCINKAKFMALPRAEQFQVLVHEFSHAVITQMYEVAP